jgi:hypothetical protein
MNPCSRLATIAIVAATTAHAQATPKTGTEVLQRMHDAYAGKWYRTLTFVQKTTRYAKDGTTNVSTWFESLRQLDPNTTQLRIDVGDPTVGNGMLYTADSTWRLRAGKVTATQGQGNEFLPLIEGVYMQPVARTAAQLQATKVDMQRVTKGRWQDRTVWIVGTSSPADTISPQFWIDAERNVVMRMILAPAPSAGTMDIRLDGYVPLAGGWLATKVAMSVGGAPVQTEEYSEWKANVELAPALFDPASWTTAPHWAAARAKNP